MRRFRLDAEDAIVSVWPDNKMWRWSFCYNDGSCHVSDFDHCISERSAKDEAYTRYRMRTNKWEVPRKRARWIRGTD